MDKLVRYLGAASLIAALVLFCAPLPAAAQGQTHIVRPGETLSSIAYRYGTTATALAAANGLANPNYIYAGQRLTIPTAGAPPSPAAAAGTYVVRPGDSLSSIAARHGTTATALARANGLANPNYIYAGQRLILPGGAAAAPAPAAGSGTYYTVRPGDTLASIAARYGTTAWAIAAANGLANPNYIYAGQRLRIPAGGTPAAPNPGGEKRIEIDLSEQRMRVYQGGQLLWNWVVSTGRPGQETAVGHYQVQNKIPNAYASTWGLQMPYWLGIYWAGSLQNGIHALPIQANGQQLWAGYLGQRVSFGCIILDTDNAATLYNWASVGTPVDVVW